MGHWLADPNKPGQAAHPGSFASSFTLSQSDNECSRKPLMPIASVGIYTTQP